jgi:hypothetical protein
MIFKDFEPITFWVTAPMTRRFKVQSPTHELDTYDQLPWNL